MAKKLTKITLEYDNGDKTTFDSTEGGLDKDDLKEARRQISRQLDVQIISDAA